MIGYLDVEDGALPGMPPRFPRTTTTTLDKPAHTGNPKATAMIRELLELAEAGQIVSFAGVAVTADGKTIEGFTERRVPLLLGAAAMLQGRMSTWCNQPPNDIEDTSETDD